MEKIQDCHTPQDGQKQVCTKHDQEKDFCFCLNIECHDRLSCFECYARDKLHNDHQFVLVENIVKKKNSDLKRMFKQKLVEMYSEGRDVREVVMEMNMKIETVMEERSNQIKVMVNDILDQERKVVQNLQEQLYGFLGIHEIKDMSEILHNFKHVVYNDNRIEKQKELKGQIDKCNQFVSINLRLEQVIRDLEAINRNTFSSIKSVFNTSSKQYESTFQGNNKPQNDFNKPQNDFNKPQNDFNKPQNDEQQQKMKKQYVKIQKEEHVIEEDNIGQFGNNVIEAEMNMSCIEEVNELKKAQKKVKICTQNDLNKFKNTLEKYESNNEQYQILLNFTNKSFNMNECMKFIDIVNQIGANHKVGAVKLSFRNKQQLDKNLLDMINTRFRNLYDVHIKYQFKDVDDWAHQKWLDIIKNRHLIVFSLQAQGTLETIKIYNNEITKKQYLTKLYYTDENIDESAEDKEKVQQLIKTIKNM